MVGDLLALLTISTTILLGAMSPGQSFVLVARTAVSSSRRGALAVSLGMGVGCMIFAIIALTGLHSILTLVPWLYTALKTAGGMYLIWLALKIFFRPQTAIDLGSTQGSELNIRRAFITGLMTQLSNPNTALVFGSIFAATLSHKIPVYMYLLLPVLALLIDFVWYGLVAYALSSDRPRRWYLGYRRYLDRISGCVMAILGVRLIMK